MLKLALRPLTESFTILQNTTRRIAIKRYSGNDMVLSFTVVDDAGDPVDISAWTTRNFGFYPAGSGTASFTKTPAFGTDGTNGVFTVTITDTDTASLDAGAYRLEVQVSGSGIKQTPVRGICILSATNA